VVLGGHGGDGKSRASHRAQAANRLLDDMSWWAKTLKPAREGMTTGVAGREQRGKAVTVTA
jgi:hypothetical protein